VFPISHNAAVALTTARYFTPSGRSIQRDYTHIEDYILSKKAPEEEREVRYTIGGRKVLGQGGISPDYEVKSSLDDIIYYFLYKGAFFSYARKFVRKETPLSKMFVFPREKREKTENVDGKTVIGRDFRADAKVIEDFKSFLKKSKIEYDSAEFESTTAEIKRWLEREMFSTLWSQEDGWWAYQRDDPVVLKAIEVFPEASSLIKQDEPVKK
jgi:carboxyl-terminal processing protease